jgi:hypothetical protein
LSAASAPPAAVIDALAQHKAEIVALLRRGRDGWSGEDWLTFFDERAGIAEFDGGLPREAAEARALECCVLEWLDRNPIRSSPSGCLRCGGTAPATSGCHAAPNRSVMSCLPSADAPAS